LNNHTDNHLFTTEQAAELLGIRPQTMNGWRTGRGLGMDGPQFVKAGRSVRYRYGELRAWVARRTYSNTVAARGSDQPH
jgi:predicted DNA-binding transcriptional regulator AlpA